MTTELDKALARKVHRLVTATQAITDSATKPGLVLQPTGLQVGLAGLTNLKQEETDPLTQLYDNIRLAGHRMRRHRPALQQKIAAETFADEKATELTPLDPSTTTPNLYYKREDLTSTRAYKVRGALNAMATLLEAGTARRFITVSTGNHALAVLKAAELLNPESVAIVVPSNTTAKKLSRLEEALESVTWSGVKATIIVEGKTFDEAKNWAMANAGDAYYLDPYNNDYVVAGQGTIGLELAEQLRPILKKNPYIEEIQVIAAIGGGGMLSGLSAGLRLSAAWMPEFRSVNINITGLRLVNIDSPLGDAIRVKHIAEANQQRLDLLNVAILPLADKKMQEGLDFIEADLGVMVEGAAAGSVFPVVDALAKQPGFEAYLPTKHRLVVSVLSGGNI